MFNAIRKNQRILMLIVVFLTILAFTFFYTYTSSIDYGTRREGVGSIYGSKIPQEKINRLIENYRLAIVLGLYDLLESLGGTVSNETAALNNFVFNQMIIEHAAKVLGVEPTDDQVARAIAERPIFQTDGRFDSTKYQNFIKNQLLPSGIKERQVEELTRDFLRVANIRKIVTGSVAVSDQEIRSAFRGYQKQDLQIVKFDFSQYLKKVEIPEDQLRQLYEKKATELNTSENRSVRYVVFDVPREKELLEGKERVEAIQAVANQASSFAESILDTKSSLEDAAIKAGLSVNMSLPFDRTGNDDTENFEGDLSKFVPSIFQLTQKQPHSEALAGSKKTRFYVFELADVNPSRPMTFEEARPQLLDALRKQLATKLLYDEGYAALEAISKQLRNGETLKDAAEKVEGSRVHEIRGTSLYASESPQDALYNEVALFLSPGELSTLQPSVEGAFAVFLKKREEINSSELAQKNDVLKAEILKKKQTLLFLEWLQSAQKEAHIQINRS